METSGLWYVTLWCKDHSSLLPCNTTQLDVTCSMHFLQQTAISKIPVSDFCPHSSKFLFKGQQFTHYMHVVCYRKWHSACYRELCGATVITSDGIFCMRYYTSPANSGYVVRSLPITYTLDRSVALLV